jgi:uncharacterized protein YebE (UPF0316 family)
MEIIASIPIWVLTLLVFSLRVADVTLGTIRTLSIVRGYIGLSMILGFVEVSLWVIVISQVLARINESWLLVIAYAGGFAAGNGVGILIERRIALGTAVVRIISERSGPEIAEALRGDDRTVTTFAGQGKHGPVTLVYVASPRRIIRSILKTARGIDPDLFFVTEGAHETGRGFTPRLRPVPHATGWRAVFKKK